MKYSTRICSLIFKGRMYTTIKVDIRGKEPFSYMSEIFFKCKFFSRRFFLPSDNKLLTFSQLYDFFKVHKEYSYNKNIPHGSCLCEICENCVLLAKGLNNKLEDPLPTNPHDLVEKFACNLNIRKCALNQCESCSS